MRVGIDYTAAAWQSAGIGRLTRELIRATVALDPRHHYTLFYAAGGLPSDSPYIAEMHGLCAAHPNVRAVPLPFTPRLLTIIWQRLRLPLSVEYFTGPLDLVHAPDFVLPPTRARTLLTVHDLTFLRHPECFEPSLQRYLARTVPRSLRRADLVMADSHATRDDLARLLHIPPQRSAVVYPGVSPSFCPLPPEHTEAVRRRLGLPPRFLLFVGTIEPRKNLVRLLEAFGSILSGGDANGAAGTHAQSLTDVHLVIAGRKGWLYDDVLTTASRPDLRERVHLLDFVHDDDLPALYNLAEVFVYPSLYEGFGLPVLEAMACGTPVVTSRVSSLPEVTGNAAVLVDPYDQQAIAAGVAEALQQTGRLRGPAMRRVQRFTWEQAAIALLACYLRVLQEQPTLEETV